MTDLSQLPGEERPRESRGRRTLRMFLLGFALGSILYHLPAACAVWGSRVP